MEDTCTTLEQSLLAFGLANLGLLTSQQMSSKNNTSSKAAKVAALFKRAVEFVRKSKQAKLSNETKLKFYGLFKQVRSHCSFAYIGAYVTPVLTLRCLFGPTDCGRNTCFQGSFL